MVCWHQFQKRRKLLEYFYDDMEWIALTMIRLYEVTDEAKYLDTAQATLELD